MHRQLSDKDCAITAIAHATGLSYTKVVNSFTDFRYLRSRRRTIREKADQIVGRRKKLGTGLEQTIRRSDRLYNRHRYNHDYRAWHFPYFCGYGISDKEYKDFFDDLGFR